MNTFIPSRKAPSPPNTLPAGHPFASHYVPATQDQPWTTLSSNTNSDSKPKANVPSSPATSSGSTISAYSGTCSDSSTPFVNLGYRQPRLPEINHRRSSGVIQPPSYTFLPTELGLLDNRPRQTLLSDIEYILGKKLHFPILSRDRTRSSQATQHENSPKGKQRIGKFRLRKEKEQGWEDDFILQGVKLLDERSRQVKKGRGVREGNWI